MPTSKVKRGDNSEFIVARSFDINKPGTDIKKLSGGILGGTITSGKLKVGQEIEISPGFKSNRKGVSTWTPVKTKIKNIVSSSYKNHSASFQPVTYISKIGLYDKDKNLIGIAGVANPVKKTEDTSYTFKLKLDI